jgi:hypothetical protein
VVVDASSPAEAQTLVRMFAAMKDGKSSHWDGSGGREGAVEAAGFAAGAEGGALHLISGSALDGADTAGVTASLAAGLAKAGCVDARLAGDVATSAVGAFARSVGRAAAASAFDGAFARGRVPGAVFDSSAGAGSAGSFRPELAASGAASLAVTSRAVASMLTGSAFGSHAAAAPAGPLGSRALQPSHLALPAEPGSPAHATASARRLSPLVSSDAASLAALTQGSAALALLVSECAASARLLGARDLADAAQAASTQLAVSRALSDAGVPPSEVLPAATASLEALSTLLQQAGHVVSTTFRAVSGLEAALAGSMPALPPHRRREAVATAAAANATAAEGAEASGSTDDAALVTALLSDSEDDRQQSDSDGTWHGSLAAPARAELRAMLEEASTAANLVGAGAAGASSALALARSTSDSASLAASDAVTAAAAEVVSRAAALEAPAAALLSALPVLAPAGAATTTPVSRVSASAAAAFSALERASLALGGRGHGRAVDASHALDACAVVAAVEHGDSGVVGGLERLARSHEAERLGGVSHPESLGVGVLGTDVALLRLMGAASLFGDVSNDARSLTVSAGAWSTLSDAAVALSTPSVMARHQHAARALVSDTASLIAAGGATADAARAALRTAVNDAIATDGSERVGTAAAIEALVGPRVLVGGGVDAAASIPRSAVVAEEEAATVSGGSALAEPRTAQRQHELEEEEEDEDGVRGLNPADAAMLRRRFQGGGGGSGAVLKQQGAAAAAAFAAEAISGFVALAAMVGLGAGSALAMVLWGVVEAEMERALPEWARAELERQKREAMRSVTLPDVFMPAVAATDALEEEATHIVTRETEAEAEAAVADAARAGPEAGRAAPETVTALPAEPSPMQEAAAALMVAHAKARSAPPVAPGGPTDPESRAVEVPSFLWDALGAGSAGRAGAAGPALPEALPDSLALRIRGSAGRGRRRVSLVAGSAELDGGWHSRRCDDLPGVTRQSRRSRFEDSRAANPVALPASDTVSLGWLLGGSQAGAGEGRGLAERVAVPPAVFDSDHRSRRERRVLSGSMSGATSLSAMLAEPVGPETIGSIRMQNALSGAGQKSTTERGDEQEQEARGSGAGHGAGAGYLKYLEDLRPVSEEQEEAVAESKSREEREEERV